MLLRRLLLGGALLSAVWLIAPPTTPFRASPPLPIDKIEPTEAPPQAPAVAKKRRTPPEAVRGIIMSGWSAGGSRFPDLLGLVERTELNTIVLDVKDENGTLSWVPSSSRAAVAGAGVAKIEDPKAKIRELHRRNIYVIGRIVVFKDPVFSQVRPDLAVQDTAGGTWRDAKGLGWMDPYSIEVWNYNLDVAIEAINAGVDEIQFDYVRFPSDGDLSRIWVRHRDERDEAAVIGGFLVYARSVLAPRGVWISADAFGLSTLARDDLGIGQRIELIAQQVDFLSLMLYPSHYNKPEYGIKDPEREPYKTISVSLADAKRRIEGTRAKLRPWLQDFSLSVRYSPVEVRAQIKAVEDAGITGWLLWNANNRYSEDALRPAKIPKQPSRSG